MKESVVLERLPVGGVVVPIALEEAGLPTPLLPPQLGLVVLVVGGGVGEVGAPPRYPFWP